MVRRRHGLSRILVLMSGLAVMAVLVTGSDVLAAGPAPAKRRIAASLLTNKHGFYQELEDGLLTEGRKCGFELDITYAEFDAAKQARQIEELISRKPDALIISPCDSTAVGESIVKANRASIPVFTVDIANRSGYGSVVSHIASDNFEGGRLAGQLMARALGGTGKVIIINHPSITSVMDRVSGFRDYLEQYPAIQIVADIPAWGQRSRATAIMEDVLMMMPYIDGVFAINDDSALGALQAIEAARVKRRIVVVGYDGTPEAVAAIRASKIYGDVVQYPRQIGVLAIQTIRDHLNGLPVKPHIAVGVGVVTTDTLGSR
ncbi:MAG: substrate-binding domain-containing protein [Firmicutes bacterium]|nr:substrate-binding domain-containing protein [Bacillota bacterium]MDH7495892.1 substrate-binding domain-containing protein [Bacillota bacterium]